MSIARFCLTLVCTAAACVVAPASAGDASPWQVRSLPDSANTRYGQHYLLALPAGYDANASVRWPLIVFLHGAGERGRDLERVKTQGLPAYLTAGHSLPAIVVAPQVPSEYLWHPLFVDAVIKEVSARYAVDAQRVALTGLSMGGMGTWATALAYPGRFASLAPISGAFPNDMVAYTYGYDQTTSADWLPALAHLSDKPIWISHGEVDQVVPFAMALRVQKTLNLLGATPQVHWMKGVGHDAWTATYSDTPAFYDWLFAQVAPAVASADPKAPDPALAGTYIARNGRKLAVSVAADRIEIRGLLSDGGMEFLPIDGAQFIGSILLRFEAAKGRPTRMVVPGLGVFFRDEKVAK